jgi:hypothetical protein
MSTAKSARRAGHVPPGAPRPSRLRELYEELYGLPNVRGCYVGWKRIGGRATRRLSVVVCVAEKPPARALTRGARVPKQVRWRVATRRTAELPTDVQVVGPGAFQGRPVVGAGDTVSAFGPPQGPPVAAAGTLGVAMRHPRFGAVVTTAAHVLGVRAFGTTTFPDGHEPVVRLHNGGAGAPVPGRVRRVVMGPSADYALISPPAGLPAENLYVDRDPLGAPFAPDRQDLGTLAFVLTARGPVRTRLRGLHADLTFDGLPFRDLLLTDFATVGGDSGSCLVDANSRVIGLLEGAIEVGGRIHSAFTPATGPFTLESGEFF